jgi:hypothetical protein
MLTEVQLGRGRVLRVSRRRSYSTNCLDLPELIGLQWLKQQNMQFFISHGRRRIHDRGVTLLTSSVAYQVTARYRVFSWDSDGKYVRVTARSYRNKVRALLYRILEGLLQDVRFRDDVEAITPFALEFHP